MHKYLYFITSLNSVTYVRWQRGTARIRQPHGCGSNRSISSAHRAHSSKSASAGLLLLWVCAGTDRRTDRQTDERTDTVPFRRPCFSYHAGSASNEKHKSVMLLQQYRITCHVYSYLNGLINLLLWNIVAVIVFILIIKLHQCRTIVYCYAKDHFKRTERNNNVQLHCYIICCFLHDAIVTSSHQHFILINHIDKTFAHKWGQDILLSTATQTVSSILATGWCISLTELSVWTC